MLLTICLFVPGGMTPSERIVSCVRVFTTETELAPAEGANARRHPNPSTVELLDGQESRFQESRSGSSQAGGGNYG